MRAVRERSTARNKNRNDEAKVVGPRLTSNLAEGPHRRSPTPRKRRKCRRFRPQPTREEEETKRKHQSVSNSREPCRVFLTSIAHWVCRARSSPGEIEGILYDTQTWFTVLRQRSSLCVRYCRPVADAISSTIDDDQSMLLFF